MAAGPSIKGTLIGKLVEDAKELLARSEGDRERLECALSADTLALLERKVEIVSWYPIEFYTELTELLWREEGKNRIEYLLQRGADAMKRTIDMGLYQQLEFLTRKDRLNRRSVPRDALTRDARLVGSLIGTLRNFGKDSLEWDPKHPTHMLHHIYEATPFPEVMRFVNNGAQTFLVQFSCPGAPPVTSERVTPDHIVFRTDWGLLLE